MSKREISILACVDSILLFIWFLGPFKNLTPVQEGLGVGLTVAFNLAFISRRSGIRLFAPREPISIGGMGARDRANSAPATKDDSVNPGFTLLRVVAGFLSIPTLGQLILVVLDLKQGNNQDALRCLAKFIGATYIIFWVFRVTKKASVPS